jgi:hypothetical protein
VTFFWSSSSLSKNWSRAEGRRSDWREFFFFFLGLAGLEEDHHLGPFSGVAFF